MRGKIAAAAFSLFIAVIMSVSATFAWITISTAPEVTSVDTSVVANGSLEIALANGTGSAPGKSAAGDSVGAGNSLRNANITWGNLVNLSDPSYGLHNVTLRPAALNESSLLSNPLSGVEYGQDGRVSKSNSNDNFGYVYWGKEAEDKAEAFLYDKNSDHLGVRAISSLQYINLGAETQVQSLYKAARDAQDQAKANYATLTNEKQEPGKSYIASIQGLMQAYAQSTIDGGLNEMDVTDYVPNLYKMLLDFQEKVVGPTGESYLNLARIYALTEADEESVKDIDTLCSLARTNTLPAYIMLDSLKQFADDRQTLISYLNPSSNTSLAHFNDAVNSGSRVQWKQISHIVNWLVNTSTCTVDGYNMSSLKSNAMQIVNKKTHSAVIQDGALKRMEQRIGQNMAPVISITIDASKIMSFIGKQTLDNITVTTNAAKPFDLETDMATLLENNKDASYKGTDAAAEDTYALAVDLWLRTNAGPRRGETGETVTDVSGKATTTSDAVFLTLEGHLLTRTTQEEVNTQEGYPVYVATYQDAEYDVYLKDDGKHYMVEGGGIVMKDQCVEDSFNEAGLDINDVKYVRKVETKTEITGYEGANRVWDSDQMSEFTGDGVGTSTTQGSGSCYVFYADTPEDQARFLDLLGSMKVALIDEEGKLLGHASMDTEHCYKEVGRVTVPLVLDKTKATLLYTDKDGRDIYGLKKLYRNVPERITALMYLDGTRLTNGMVLAAGDIQGTLNIQFSSTEVTEIVTTETVTGEDGSTSTVTRAEYTEKGDNTAIRNPELMNKFINVTAGAAATEFKDFDFDNPPSTTLTVQVDGVTPKAVTARFTRRISATQGALREEMTFTNADGSNWTASYTFQNPGTFMLRSVYVDGAEYALQTPVTVVVHGDKLVSTSCGAIASDRSAKVMTADSSFSTEVTLRFVTDKTIRRLTAVFEDAQGRQVQASLRTGPQGLVWSGTATFPSTGVYTLKYYRVDGEYYPIDEELQLTLDLTLGLKAQTWVTCSEETLAELQAKNPQATANRFTLEEGKPVTLDVSCRLFDNSGSELRSMGGVKLTYGRAGSGVDKLDSDMKWNASTGRYEGHFSVEKAGTYQYAYVNVGSNIITRSTSAPAIQAMPPHDAYYYSNMTPAYQYTKGQDGKVSLNVAYSNAATKVEAVLVKDGAEKAVAGVIGDSGTSASGESFSQWDFPLTDEGRYTVKAIRLYGVYYGGKYYDDTEGAEIDLSGKNISAKVVKKLHITLNGGADQGFTGYFMDSHKVSGMTVAVADYEGEPIQGIKVTDVSVTYYLDHTKVTMEDYGYTGDTNTLAGVTVSGTGTAQSGAANKFNISDLDFRYAGPYTTCEVSVTVDGEPHKAGCEHSQAHFTQNGKLADSFPVYDVKFTAPTLKVTAVSPGPETIFKINPGSRSTATRVNGHNFISPDGFYARLSADGTKATTTTAPVWSKATIVLSDCGQSFTSAAFTVTAEVSGTHYDADYSYTPGSLSVTKAIGGGGGFSSALARAGYQKFETIDVVYGGNTYRVKLSHPLEIYGQDTGIPQFAYSAGEYAERGVQVPAGTEFPYYTQALNAIVLGSVDDAHKEFADTYVEAGDLDNTRATTNESSFVAYYEGSEGSGCNKKTVYFPYTVKTVVVKTPADQNTYNADFTFAGWTIQQTNQQNGAVSQYGGGRTYKPGTKLTFGTNAQQDYLATPVYQVGEKTLTSTVEKNYVVTTVTVTAGTKTETKPSGTKYDSAGDITKLAGTTEGWE